MIRQLLSAQDPLLHEPPPSLTDDTAAVESKLTFGSGFAIGLIAGFVLFMTGSELLLALNTAMTRTPDVF